MNEQDAKHDERLKAIWTEYDAFRTLGLTATNALIFFSNEDYLQSLLCFAKLKQSETQWKEHLKLETRLAADYPVLENIGFDSLVKKYGRLCIKVSISNRTFNPKSSSNTSLWIAIQRTCVYKSNQRSLSDTRPGRCTAYLSACACHHRSGKPCR